MLGVYGHPYLGKVVQVSHLLDASVLVVYYILELHHSPGLHYHDHWVSVGSVICTLYYLRVS